MPDLQHSYNSQRAVEEFDIPWKDLVLDPSDIYLSMGRDYVPDEEMLCYLGRLLEEVGTICCPRALYCVYEATPRFSRNHIGVESLQFRTGPIISSFLYDADKYAIFVATAGVEFQRFQEKVKASGDIYKEFVLDCVGTAIAEACVRYLCSQVERRYVPQGDIVSYPYSPGYCGWHVTQQQILFPLLPEHPCNIQLSETSLMLPIKSVSGIVGIGKQIKKRGYGCEICNKKDCYKNRSKHRKTAS